MLSLYKIKSIFTEKKQQQIVNTKILILHGFTFALYGLSILIMMVFWSIYCIKDF